MGKKKLKPADAAPLDTGASAPASVSPDLAARASADVEAARSAPRPPPLTGTVEVDTPKKRGRPPGSKNKAKQEEQESSRDPAEPEEFEEIVDLFNLWCEANLVQPVGEQEKEEWAKRAAKVANRWGGSLPLFPEISLLICTGAVFGPRVLQITDPEHQAMVKAKKEQAEAEKQRRAMGGAP